MSQTKLMPTLFIGHGSPMNAIEDNEFAQAWRDAAQRLPKPKAVLCISAHWETHGPQVSATARPETIHDFYGFPPELGAVRYPAPGAPELAEQLCESLSAFGVSQDFERGLDHGAWSVLRRMYPAADVPVLQLSLDSAQPGDFHYRLGQALQGLRTQGVLVLGSGNIVHNLRLYDFYDQTPQDWAVVAEEAMGELILRHDHAALVDFHHLPNAGQAIPTPEHYLPLLYILGLRASDEPAQLFCRTVLGSLSMDCLAFGL